MHIYIANALQALLMSDAYAAEQAAYITDLVAGVSIPVRDVNGAATTVLVQDQNLAPLVLQDCQITDPPRAVPGPYPIAYVYHIQSEYPLTKQEDTIRFGMHRMGISLYAAGDTPQDGEIMGQLLATACVNLIERNARMFSSLPKAMGGSSVTFAETEVSGQKLPKGVSPIHLMLQVHLRELRTYP